MFDQTHKRVFKAHASLQGMSLKEELTFSTSLQTDGAHTVVHDLMNENKKVFDRDYKITMDEGVNTVMQWSV